MKIFKQPPVILGMSTASSVDPEKISLTIKSMGLMLIPIIIAVAKMFDVSLAEADLTALLAGITGIISLVGTIYGAGRRIYYQIIK